jgi:hypothetical protein
MYLHDAQPEGKSTQKITAKILQKLAAFVTNI